MLKFKDCGFKEKHSFKEYESVIVKVGDYHQFLTFDEYKYFIIIINGNGNFQCISIFDERFDDNIATWEEVLENWYDETDFEIVQYFENNFLLDITIASKIEK